MRLWCADASARDVLLDRASLKDLQLVVERGPGPIPHRLERGPELLRLLAEPMNNSNHVAQQRAVRWMMDVVVHNQKPTSVSIAI